MKPSKKRPDIQIVFSKDPRVTPKLKQRIENEARADFDRRQADARLKQQLELTPQERKRAIEIQTRLLDKLGILAEVQELAEFNRQVSERRQKLMADEDQGQA